MRRAAFGAALAALLLMLACHAASAASPAGVPAPLASAYEQFAHNAAPVADAIKELFRKPSLHQVGVTWTEFWALIGPGGKLHPAKFLEHKGHLVIEGALLLVLAVMFLQQTYKPQAAGEAPLSERVGRAALAARLNVTAAPASVAAHGDVTFLLFYCAGRCTAAGNVAPYARHVGASAPESSARLAPEAHGYMLPVHVRGVVAESSPLPPPNGTQEIDQLCAEWRPEPLAPAITAKEAAVLTATPVVESVVDATHVVVRQCAKLFELLVGLVAQIISAVTSSAACYIADGWSGEAHQRKRSACGRSRCSSSCVCQHATLTRP